MSASGYNGGGSKSDMQVDQQQWQQQAQPQHQPNLNRKATKIEYLSQENAQLKEDNAELTNMLKLNKEALRIAMTGLPSQLVSHTPTNASNNNQEFNGKLRGTSSNSSGVISTTIPSSDNSQQPQAINLILNSLYEENAALSRKIERITQERDVAQSKAFINEQISEASQKHEQELIAELEDKVKKLSEKLRDSEKTIHQLERSTPEYDEATGIVIKYRDVISLSDQTKVMHDEMEKLNTIIAKQLRTIESLRSDRQDLLKLNMSLSNEVMKLKSGLSSHQLYSRVNTPVDLSQFTNPLNQPNQQQQQQPNQPAGPNAALLLKFHQKMNKNGNESEDELDDDEEYSFDQLQDKFEKYASNNAGPVAQKQPADAASQSTQMSVLPGEDTKHPQLPPLGLAIPKLDLTKARAIMDMNAKKSTQQQQLKEAQSGSIQQHITKIQKLEKEIDVVRRNLSREMLMNKTLTIENEGVKRVNKEIEARNEILVQSHAMFEEKWTKIVTAFEFYKDFYKKHSEAILSGTINSKSPDADQSIQQDNDNSYDAERIMRIKGFQNPQQGMVSGLNYSAIQKFQKSLLEVNDGEIAYDDERKQQLIADSAYSLVNARDFIKQIAVDLNQFIENSKQNNTGNPKKQQNPLQTEQKRPLKRSFSNTLEYSNPSHTTDNISGDTNGNTINNHNSDYSPNYPQNINHDNHTNQQKEEDLESQNKQNIQIQLPNDDIQAIDQSEVS